MSFNKRTNKQEKPGNMKSREYREAAFLQTYRLFLPVLLFRPLLRTNGTISWDDGDEKLTLGKVQPNNKLNGDRKCSNNNRPTQLSTHAHR